MFRTLAMNRDLPTSIGLLASASPLQEWNRPLAGPTRLISNPVSGTGRRYARGHPRGATSARPAPTHEPPRHGASCLPDLHRCRRSNENAEGRCGAVSAEPKSHPQVLLTPPLRVDSRRQAQLGSDQGDVPAGASGPENNRRSEPGRGGRALSHSGVGLVAGLGDVGTARDRCSEAMYGQTASGAARRR